MRILSVALLAALLLPLPAFADTFTYTYTGNDFTVVQGSYTLTDSVTGEFALSAPLSDTTSYDAIPTSFSFSDGIQTITNSTPGISVFGFDVTTDASGDIVSWLIDIGVLTNSGSGNYFTSLSTANVSNGAIDSGYNPFTGNEGSIRNDPGTWTVTDNPAATPEPSSLILLGSGLAAAAAFGRRLREA
jgi:hypothetical protein